MYVIIFFLFILFAAADMTYWSNVKIKPIEIMTPSQDTNLIIKHRKGSSVGAYAVTATSYAMLAYMANNEPRSDLESMQRFLQEQRLGVGAFYSTQVNENKKSITNQIAYMSTISKFCF